MTARKKDTMRDTILNAIWLNTRSLADIHRTRRNLIVRAVQRGISQTTVADAAGLSQAHVSRIVAAHRKADEARKAARRSKRQRESRTV